MTASPLSFLVVGSPRSGTTLVQRLACELVGVGMPPETHFLDFVVPDLENRGGYGREQVAAALRNWLAQPQLAGVDVDVERLLAAVGHRRSSPGVLFEEVVRQLRPDSPVRGEKTPAHGAWWRPLARFAPSLCFVAVVRDPRAVVVSNIGAPWSGLLADPTWGVDLDVAAAEHWRHEQANVLAMRREIPRRCLVLRYEQVVADPERARTRIAELLGIDPSNAAGAAVDPSMVLPWETWKASALGPITNRRVDAWRAEIAPARAALVAAVCAGPMRALGFPDAPGRARATARLTRLPAHTMRSLRGLRRGLADRRSWIESVVL